MLLEILLNASVIGCVFLWPRYGCRPQTRLCSVTSVALIKLLEKLQTVWTLQWVGLRARAHQGEETPAKKNKKQKTNNIQYMHKKFCWCFQMWLTSRNVSVLTPCSSCNLTHSSAVGTRFHTSGIKMTTVSILSPESNLSSVILRLEKGRHG